MQKTVKCLECGETCYPKILEPCSDCKDGSNAYYWPCGVCGHTHNGAQCGRAGRCAGATVP